MKLSSNQSNAEMSVIIHSFLKIFMMKGRRFSWFFEVLPGISNSFLPNFIRYLFDLFQRFYTEVLREFHPVSGINPVFSYRVLREVLSDD